MPQVENIYRELNFFAQGGATKMSGLDSDDSATILYWRPKTNDTGALYFGDGTTDFDVRFYTGSGIYAAFDVGADALILVGMDMDLSTSGTGTYDIILKDSVADALSIRRATTDMMVFDSSTPRIDITPAMRFAGTVSFTGAGDIDLPANSVDKADLATEVYTIEHVLLTGNTNDFDNQTVKLSRLWSAGTVVRVVYFTTAAIGTTAGIDILDGGTDGSGTDVINSCSDDLNGLDSNNLSTPYALSADDYICVKFDDLTAAIDFTVDIQVKVPAGAAT